MVQHLVVVPGQLVRVHEDVDICETCVVVDDVGEVHHCFVAFGLGQGQVLRARVTRGGAVARWVGVVDELRDIGWEGCVVVEPGHVFGRDVADDHGFGVVASWRFNFARTKGRNVVEPRSFFSG